MSHTIYFIDETDLHSFDGNEWRYIWMEYPDVDPAVQKQRRERAIAQLRVGDIVDAWLDCTPDAGHTRPLPVIIIKTPNLRETNFIVKSLFGSTQWQLNFTYAWKKVGHIDGLDELLQQEEQHAHHSY